MYSNMPGTRTVRETTVHAIGRCPVKSCKNRKRHTRPGIVKANRVQTWTEWTIPAPAPYDAVNPYVHVNYGQRPSRFDTSHPFERAYLQAMHDAGLVCVDHDVFFKIGVVNGVYSEDKTCNSRCTNAVGFDCECSCAGAQHGAAHA